MPWKRGNSRVWTKSFKCVFDPWDATWETFIREFGGVNNLRNGLALWWHPVKFDQRLSAITIWFAVWHE